MNAPLAYHLTWTTYGSWLPGDERGWVARDQLEIQAPDPERLDASSRFLVDDPVTLNDMQRVTVEQTIVDHCAFRNWTLHARNVRTQHIHVVLTAPVTPETALKELKTWATRRLNEAGPRRERWWTHHGSTKWIFDEAYLANAIRYVKEGQ